MKRNKSFRFIAYHCDNVNLCIMLFFGCFLIDIPVDCKKRFDDDVGMVDNFSRQVILERRARLLDAVRILQKEIACLDEEAARKTGRQKPELTEEFFWRNVFPVMVAEREIASGKLRRRLVDNGLHIDDARFRTFLSRYRDKGFVELKGRVSGRPKWKLTEAAFQKAAGRVSPD